MHGYPRNRAQESQYFVLVAAVIRESTYALLKSRSHWENRPYLPGWRRLGALNYGEEESGIEREEKGGSDEVEAGVADDRRRRVGVFAHNTHQARPTGDLNDEDGGVSKLSV